MTKTIHPAEPTIPLATFAGPLATMVLWAVAAPRRPSEAPRETSLNYGFKLPWRIIRLAPLSPNPPKAMGTWTS